METAQSLIGGDFVKGDFPIDVINPATGRSFASVGAASIGQLERAIGCATAAFSSWSALALEDRASALARIASRLEGAVHELAKLLTLEQGKPLQEALGEIQAAAAFFRHYSELPFAEATIEAGSDRHVELRRRALGVVAAIVPWNYPMALMAFKLPPALLAGNCIVLKPAPTTPLTTLRFAELVADCVPPGVINVVADGGSLGQALTQHPGVRKISFTGSTETGRLVMAGAATTLKRLTLELGGNDAAILLEDCDPKAVAESIFPLAFTNAGQICIAVKRLYVHADIYDAVWEELKARAETVSVGDGMAPETQVGPIQNFRQYQRVCSLLEDARRQGAQLSSAAGVPPNGYFIRPTIVRDINEGARLVDEEQFGPALPMLKFTSPDEAVRRANGSEMGLGTSVWSRDSERALHFARQLDVGTAWVNKHADLLPSIPFGGAKQSGFGVELGNEALSEFTQLQVINQRVSPQ